MSGLCSHTLNSLIPNPCFQIQPGQTDQHNNAIDDANMNKNVKDIMNGNG